MGHALQHPESRVYQSSGPMVHQKSPMKFTYKALRPYKLCTVHSVLRHRIQRPQKVKKVWESQSASRCFLRYIMTVVIILWQPLASFANSIGIWWCIWKNSGGEVLDLVLDQSLDILTIGILISGTGEMHVILPGGVTVEREKRSKVNRSGWRSFTSSLARPQPRISAYYISTMNYSNNIIKQCTSSG